MDIASEFRSNVATAYKSQASVAQREIRKKITFNFLVKFLKRHRDCFKRYVTQSAKNELHHPNFPEIYYYCHYHIGRIGGYEWFFDDCDETVMVYRSRALKPIPLVEELGCEVFRSQIEEIVNYLDKTKLVKKAGIKVVVPKNFYVFEFKAKHRTGQPKVITITPFKSKNLDKAIEIFRQCPWYYYRDCACFSDFRVCTNEGWRNLKHTLQKYANPWDGDLSRYMITAE